MSGINKINLKALKENYMKKPEEKKKEDDETKEIPSQEVWIENVSEVLWWEENKESKLWLEKKSETLSWEKNWEKVNNEWEKINNEKELFSKYESFFKRESNKIKDKLVKKEENTWSSKAKKYVINLLAWVALLQLIIIPWYFVYSWWNLDSIKASIFNSKENNDNSNKDNNVKNNNKNEDNNGIVEEKENKEEKQKNDDENKEEKENSNEENKEEKIIKEKEEINIWWYIFSVDIEKNSSWIKTYIYNSKVFKNKYELKKELKKELKELKRKKLIELLLKEKKIKKETNKK